MTPKQLNADLVSFLILRDISSSIYPGVEMQQPKNMLGLIFKY